MRFILPLLLVMAVLFYLQRSFAPEKKRDRPDLPGSVKEKSFLSSNEQMLVTALIKALGDDYLFFPKIPVLDLLEMKDGKKVVGKAREYIADKRVDIALYDKDNFKLKAAVIIQDLSSNSSIDTDWLKKLLEKAGIIVIRLHKRKIWDADMLKEKINERLTAVSSKETSKVTPFPKKNPVKSAEEKDAEN